MRTPEDIYQTEGVRSFAAKQSTSNAAEAKQEELLNIAKPAAVSSFLQTQQPVNSKAAAVKRIEPTPVPNFAKTNPETEEKVVEKNISLPSTILRLLLQ